MKTNVIRMLDKWGIDYELFDYTESWAVSWLEVADVLKISPDFIYKTLVTEGKSRKNYVFLIPVSKELNLKKAAEAVNEKSIGMIKSKDLFTLTWYIHGWCSMIWMKKQFPIMIDSSVKNSDFIIFNAWKIWYQVKLNLKDLEEKIEVSFDELT